ncbi:MAG: sulfatase [Planctomycetota bacterium]
MRFTFWRSMRAAIACMALVPAMGVSVSAAPPGFAAAPAPTTGSVPRPNVLFIVVDDLTKALACYGFPVVQTPNVDRLAQRAIRFDRAYCQYPVCSPSRVSFLSGRRPERTGMFGNEGSSRTPQLKDAVFLPEHFRKQGYFTGRLGKVFHIGRDVPECWDVTEEGTPNNAIIYQPSEVQKLGLEDRVVRAGRLEGGGGEGNNWTVLRGGEEQLVDWRIGTRVAELIDDHGNGEKPFFIACGFRRPHLPHLAPQSYFDTYDPAGVPMPLDAPVRYRSIKLQPSESDTREGMRSYLACVTFMDKQLGRVLDALDRGNRWERTIVVLLGDNGYHLGSRGGFWGKGLGYEESCGVPLLVAMPGRTTADTCSRLVEYVDLYPTLVECCGLPGAAGLDGRSIRPLLERPDAEWDHPAFSMTARQGKPAVLAVSTERYRLIENPGGDVELYDLKTDPHEWKNLAEDAAHAEALARLRSLAKEHRAKFWKVWEE